MSSSGNIESPRIDLFRLLEKDSNQPILVISKSSILAQTAITELPNVSVMELNEPSDMSSIGIDKVREISSLTSVNSNKLSVLVIYNFSRATLEAQNSFLKSLEETVSGLRFVIVASSKSSVIKTVSSRCIEYKLARTHKQDLVDMAHSDYNPLNVNSLEIEKIHNALSGDFDALVDILSESKKMNNFENIVQSAKNIFVDSSDALKNLAGIYKSKDDIIKLVAVMATIAESKILSDKTNRAHWTAVARAIVDSKQKLNEQVNPKLVLDSLVMKI